MTCIAGVVTSNACYLGPGASAQTAGVHSTHNNYTCLELGFTVQYCSLRIRGLGAHTFRLGMIRGSPARACGDVAASPRFNLRGKKTV